MKNFTTVLNVPVALALSMLLCSCRGPQAPAGGTLAAEEDAEGWKALFDGKTLKGWRVPEFGGDGKVYVKDGAVHMEQGHLCTGITYTGTVPQEDFEVTLEGMRVDGSDFWCALTFPVGDSHATLVLGGWGGSLVGLSCIDYLDASENETTKIIPFQNNRWYRVLVQVTKERVECWLDDEEVVSVQREGKKFSLRAEVDECVPLGITTWQTHGAVRDIRLRALPE